MMRRMQLRLTGIQTPRQIPKEKYSDIFGDFTPLIIASNARTRAERLRSLGWAPKQPTLAEAFANEEIPILQKDKGEFAGYGAAVAS